MFEHAKSRAVRAGGAPFLAQARRCSVAVGWAVAWGAGWGLAADPVVSGVDAAAPAVETSGAAAGGAASPERFDIDSRRAKAQERENELPRNRDVRILRTVPPEYPQDFQGTGVTATVEAEIIVDRRGRASHVRVVSSLDPAFTEVALDSLSQWEFLPAIRETKLTNTPLRVSVLVTEDFGDNQFFDYQGGRIALLDVGYAGEYDDPVKRRRGLRAPYPFDMLAADQAGEVVLEFDVAEGGAPRHFEVIESTNEQFALAAQGAVAHWVFEPARKAFVVVPARLRYRISFQPEDYSEATRQMARDIKAGRPIDVAKSTEIDETPMVMRHLKPVCPPDFGIELGRQRVTIGLIVTGEGDVLLPRVTYATDPKAAYLALAAVNFWHFRPAQMHRLPVPVMLSVPVVF